MNILFIGDIFGRPGRDAVRKALPELRRELAPDMIIANCENSAGGKGVTPRIAEELFGRGIDVLTGGNHSFYQRDTNGLFDQETRLLRPENFPPGTPGRGIGIYDSSAGFPVAVLNLCGRAFMDHYADPFRTIDRLIDEARRETPIIFVDFHAETTSEKVAMGWYVDGRVTAMVGTHTHIPTADERVLPGGTAHITDTGMTGPYDSVIGADKDAVLGALLTLRPHRFGVAEPRDVRLCGVLVEVDQLTGRALRIERVRRDLGDL
ncbi:MAG: 2,3-cyclic-nucleotide 2-phosphodiesterase [Candidatus Sumerlaeota bacterium]|nr:2,3-cyclic-nucleotide 2-phosphodiesterase [Candidatus Sumerlaeota bacterium]